MKRLPLLALMLCPILAASQAAVDIAADPHYHLLLENNQVRVFDALFRPNEKAYVRYPHNYLVVTLRDCELVMWQQGSSSLPNFRFSRGDVRFQLGGQSEGIRNDRSSECRNITVEFLNPKVTRYYFQTETGLASSAGLISAPVDPHAKFSNGMNLGAAVARDVQLLPGDSFPAPEKPAAELLIPITDVDLTGEGDIRIHKATGEVTWLGESRKSKLTDSSDGPARFVIVELWIEPGRVE